MAQKLAAIAAVMISLISVLAGVSVMSGDVSAEDSVPDGYNLIFTSDQDHSSSSSQTVDYSLVDGVLEFFIHSDHSTSHDLYFDCILVNPSIDKIIFESDSHTFRLNYFDIESSDGSPLNFEDVCFDYSISDPGFSGGPIIGNSFSVPVYSPLTLEYYYTGHNGEMVHFVVQILYYSFDLPTFVVDLADECTEIDRLFKIPGFDEPTLLFGQMFDFVFFLPDGFDFRSIYDITDSLGSDLDQIDPSLIHSYIVPDDTVSVGSYQYDFSYFDTAFSDLGSYDYHFALYPDYTGTIEVIDSSSSTSEDPEPTDPEPEDPVPSGDAPVADSEIIGIPGTAFWIAAGLLLLVIVLAVCGHAGGRRR